MAVLGRNILENHGPYIWCSVVDSAFDEAWPERSAYDAGIFIEFAEDLVGIYCSLTQSYAPFDQYAFIQIERPHDIYEFTTKLLMWESQLAKTPVNYFSKHLEYFQPSDSYLKDEIYTGKQFKVDLLETLHFIVGEMHKASASGRCVIIVGI